MILPAMGVISEVVQPPSPARTCSATRRSPTPRWASPSSASSPGATTSSPRASRPSTPASSACSRCSWAIFTAIKVFNWVGHALQGRHRVHDALRLLLRLPLLPGLRRHDRHRAGHGVARRPLARHLLRGGPLPLHHGGRRRSWPSWPALHYWFPKMFGRMYPERWALVAAVAHRPRLQRHLHPAVPARQRGHAAPLLHATRSGSRPQRGLDRGRLAARLRLRHHRSSTWSSRWCGARSRATTPGTRAATSG